MKNIEMLREMEAKATPGPWQEGSHDGRPIPITIWSRNHPNEPITESRANLVLIQILRNLAPDLLAIWETGYQVGHAFDTLSATFDGAGNPTDATEPLQDEMHQRFVAFAAAMNALNKRASEMLQ